MNWLREKIELLNEVWRLQNDPALATHLCECGHWPQLHFKTYYQNTVTAGCAGNGLVGSICRCKAYKAPISIDRVIQLISLVFRRC